MGWWLILAWLDAGVPASTAAYMGLDEQRCLQVADEHLEANQMRPGSYVEVIYINCLPASAPRIVRGSE